MTNSDPFCFCIDESAHDDRLDKFLAEALSTLVSRERVKQLIQQGCVTLNSEVLAKPALRLKTGQVLQVTLPDPVPITLTPEAIPLSVVYEDEDVMVINKPSGMLTHPTGKEQTGTLVNALLHYCQGQLSGINGALRPGIVHRLDRQTSGLMMVAKTDRAHRGLSMQLAERQAKREYRAIAQGNPSTEKGTIHASIGRCRHHRDKMTVDSKTGRDAITHWTVLERFHNRFFMAQLNLETGRTHQIRVHLASQGFPILGDPLYGTGLIQQLSVPKALKTYGQFLQAVGLRFIHPVQQKLLTFSLPLAPEMAEMCSLLSQDDF